jgi:hypothetical protein
LNDTIAREKWPAQRQKIVNRPMRCSKSRSGETRKR